MTGVATHGWQQALQVGQQALADLLDAVADAEVLHADRLQAFVAAGIDPAEGREVGVDVDRQPW